VLTAGGWKVSPSGVRGVWVRYGFETRAKRVAHAKLPGTGGKSPT
jgi:hypothetical protein